MKKNSGITLLALIITIIIMLIFAGVTISIVGGSDGIIAKAEKAVSETDKASMQEDAELSIAAIKMDYYENYSANRAKYANAKAFIVEQLKDEYETSRGATMVADETGEITYTYKGVSTIVAIDDNGKVTLGESSGSGDKNNVGTIYYGDSTVVPTDQKYFTFAINEDGQTATITGIKEEYAVKTYYRLNGSLIYGEEQYYNCAINDNGTYITDIVIPYEYVDGENAYVVTNIGECAFAPIDGFTGVDKYEAEYMFTSFVIPNTVTTIERFGFANCIKVTEFVIPDSVTSIGDYAFDACASIEIINISEQVTSIGYGAFTNCTSLNSINIPASVTSIESFVFSGCANLKSVNIPESVTSMGSFVFHGWIANQTINCEVASAPSGWDAQWDYYANYTARKAQLNWGVSM